MVIDANKTELKILDAHSHLRFAKNGADAAKELETRGVFLIDTGVAPGDIKKAEEMFSHCENVFLAPGLHPWWVADKTCSIKDAYTLAQLCSQYKFIGEIGLDFSRKCLMHQTQQEQIQAFNIICQAAASPYKDEKHILSIHSVKSATQVLDILEDTGCTKGCKCIFHWFSGSQEELIRAIEDGCWFSIGSKGLLSKRWKNYAKIIPDNRLLIETDLPEIPCDYWPAEEEIKNLEDSIHTLDQYLGKSTYEVLRQSSLDLCYS